VYDVKVKLQLKTPVLWDHYFSDDLNIRIYCCEKGSWLLLKCLFWVFVKIENVLVNVTDISHINLFKQYFKYSNIYNIYISYIQLLYAQMYLGNFRSFIYDFKVKTKYYIKYYWYSWMLTHMSSTQCNHQHCPHTFPIYVVNDQLQLCIRPC
jgi:hypothetical protein